MLHSLGPSISSFPTTANFFVVLDDQRAVSAIHALLSAFWAPYQESAPTDSTYLDLAQVARKIAQAPNAEEHYPYLKAALNVLISAVQQGVALPPSLQPLAGLINDIKTEDAKLTKLLARLDTLVSSRAEVDEAAVDNID